MPKKMKILVLAAHPDDEALGCGATISKLSSEGHLVHLITFTNGVSARNSNQKSRTQVLGKACESLGIKSYDCADFPDNAMDSVSVLTISQYIEKKITYCPDIIFTHFPNCLNVDHRMVYQATLTAFRPQNGHSQKIYSYFIPSSTDYSGYPFDGNVYFDVSKSYKNKLKCLKECYEIELRKYPHTRSLENVENLMKVWGSEVGLKYAEKFKLIREIV